MFQDFPCTKEAIDGALNACEYVQLACQTKSKYFDFIGFYYCELDQNVGLTTVLSILFVLFVFHLLSSTASDYLAPALELIAQKLNMSDAIAGVTLLAFANSAMDVISGIVAGGKGEEGVQIATGALFGGCLFTITFVIARCIYGAQTIKVSSKNIKRDIVFLLIAILYFIILGIINTITPPLVVGFFLIYIIFITYVIYQEKTKKEENAALNINLLDNKEDFPTKNEEINLRISPNATSERIDFDLISPLTARRVILHMKRKGSSKSPTYSNKKSLGLSLKDDSEPSKSKIEEMEQEKKSFVEKIVDLYNAPLVFVRDLTMPPFEEEYWNPYIAAFTPIFGLFFAIWQIGFIEILIFRWYLWILYGGVTLPLFFWILIEGRKRNLVKDHAGKFAIATLLISALWLNFIVTWFMDFLSLLTVISGLPLDYLSLTLVAWGNSLDDFFIDYYIAKSGHGEMAITGAYAGQLFNLLIGFGGAMLRETLSNRVKLNIFYFEEGTEPGSILIILLVVFLIISLMLMLIFGKASQWILGKKIMLFFSAFYLGFLVIVTIISLVWCFKFICEKVKHAFKSP